MSPASARLCFVALLGAACSLVGFCQAVARAAISPAVPSGDVFLGLAFVAVLAAALGHVLDGASWTDGAFCLFAAAALSSTSATLASGGPTTGGAAVGWVAISLLGAFAIASTYHQLDSAFNGGPVGDEEGGTDVGGGESKVR